MGAFKHIIAGEQINGITYIKEVAQRNGERFILAKCFCGNEWEVRLTYLRNKHTKSCGCAKIAECKSRATHGHTHRGNINRTYTTYRDMRTRCENVSYKEFNLYGGRGIKVCDRWSNYENFLADMGERPDGLSIERKDVNGDYSPDNCIWANNEIQANNKRNSVLLDYQGKVQTVAQWARELGILDKTIYFRLSKGWSTGKALTPISS